MISPFWSADSLPALLRSEKLAALRARNDHPSLNFFTYHRTKLSTLYSL
jgi:hypothetical protein